MNRAWLGVLLVLLALRSGSLFFVRGYHDLYWLNPAVFIILTVIGVASALAGGFLVGRTLIMRQKGRVGVLRSLSLWRGLCWEPWLLVWLLVFPPRATGGSSL